MTSELLTTQETAAYLKVSLVTVRRLIKSHRLPAVRIGRALRVRREDLDSLLCPTLEAGKEPAVKPYVEPPAEPRLFTMEDAFWDIVGIGADIDGPTDVSENKYKYLAEAYEPARE